MSEGSKKTKWYRIDLISERCKGCGFCIEFCPRRLLRQSAEINSKGYHTVYLDSETSDKCTGCDICSMICPDFALNVVVAGEEGERARR